MPGGPSPGPAHPNIPKLKLKLIAIHKQNFKINWMKSRHPLANFEMLDAVKKRTQTEFDNLMDKVTTDTGYTKDEFINDYGNECAQIAQEFINRRLGRLSRPGGRKRKRRTKRKRTKRRRRKRRKTKRRRR
tara:strand:- start:405 stop:797 length:393 start_codon:yes stop_codon:yes gene_type:complete